jgi:4-amino-4-deoxy-L-arabinose transferase-like glycosyltransferase
VNARLKRFLMNSAEFSPETILQSNRSVWVVGALLFVLFAVTNLPWHLDNYDQAKQAFTSFQMVKEGRWFYQQTPHERVATKPPLVGWISAGLFAATRSWDLAWRLPSFLAAVALSILLFRAAKSAYGSLAALLALSAFGFNLLTPRLATLVRTDMPLAFVIFLIGLQIWTHAREQRAWDTRDRRWLFVLLTTGMLIKGPIVYAFIFPGVLAFVWSLRKAPRIGGRGCGWWPWLGSLAVFLVWVIGGIIFQPGFFDQVVMREFLGRFGTTVHQPKQFFFYLPHLLHKFFPWSVLMIALAIVDLRTRQWRLRGILREMRPETLWLICWTFGGLLVMSLIPSKRVDRVFPVIPPLCLLLAAQIGNIWRREELRERVYRWSAAAVLLSMLFTGGYSFFKVISGYRGHRDALVAFGREVRKDVATRHWRLEVVRAADEGLLLYLERPHFIWPEDAVAQWNRAQIDALVAPTEEAPELMRQLHDAALSQLRSAERKDEQGFGYVLITR